MVIVKEILEHLKNIPESAQAEVLDFVQFLESKRNRKGEEYEWSRFSLESAMKGIEEEPTSYGIDDLEERFS